ncbi:nucleotidyltransferase domain-containing protein [Actinospica durhamensis]|uniref:Nucleotidyltransferase domain-containing protein n=1 Tax=Actinospica durhamensis TaxID=1508375 RepID=A0A941EQ18_9ACTN|nr:nucleotidyltransferase domain-containing protein [Actinospica durhamensis]MBR7835056.1 nucleotidyltransferase domain-containing protein [Actinospica durhamensis]
MDTMRGLVLPAELDTYLAELDRVLPAAAVAGVYLVGSTALGDYRPGMSDLDILTLTQRHLSDDELEALDGMHRRLEKGTQPHLDAEYLPCESLGRQHEEGSPGHAHVVEGQFHRGGHGQELIVWATLDQRGITLRGPEAASWNAAPDADALRAWNLENLEVYWRAGFGQRAREVLQERDPDSELSATWAIWTATGPGRLHHTIATGEIISKTAAADYAAELFPAYAPILARAKASRLGDESASFVARDGLALTDPVDEICDDAANRAARPR